MHTQSYITYARERERETYIFNGKPHILQPVEHGEVAINIMVCEPAAGPSLAGLVITPFSVKLTRFFFTDFSK